MRQFYRVCTYNKMSDITTNPVFFHDRKNAEAYFNKLASSNGAAVPEEQLMVKLVDHENTMRLFSENQKFAPKNWLVAFGDETNVYFDTLNFED